MVYYDRMEAVNSGPRINVESQKLLAKLLAKENITVQIGNYRTAFFDTKSRVLGLPTWNTDSKTISDLLVGHEVGHALYTPIDAIDRFKLECPEIPFCIANIVEDVRIERMIQENYPGLVYSFKDGYRQFIERDFLEIEGKDLNTMTFADRLNTHAKLGSQVGIPLTDSERAIYDRCYKATSFDEVIEICKDIYDMIKEEIDKEKKEAKNKEYKNSDEEDPIEDVEDSSENDSESSADAEKFKPDYSKQDQFKSETTDALSKNLDSLKEIVTDYFVGNSPCMADALKRVIPVADIMADRRVHLDNYNFIMNDELVKADWKAFQETTKKHLAVLVKEFERRKSAFQYSRAQQSMTGTIDVNRLHAYKFDDKIFKSITNLADAKNHGMMFFIDYSGSMRHSISDVINQTLQLTLFCKAVGIPFEVYGFTSPHYSNAHIINIGAHLPGHNISFSDLHLFELLNSNMNKSNFMMAARELKAQGFKFLTMFDNNNGAFPFRGKYEVMGMTPLNEMLIAAHELVKRFRSKHNVQKMNTLILTDGNASHQVPVIHNNSEYEYEPVKTIRSSSPSTKIKINGSSKYIELIPRGRSTDDNKNTLYRSLIDNLRNTCDTTVLGFFIGNNSQAHTKTGIASIRHSHKNGTIGSWDDASELLKKKKKDCKEDRCLVIENGFGYNGYFIFDGSSSLSDNEDTDFDSDAESSDGNFVNTADRNKLAKDFIKFNKEKKISRVFLNKFIDLIA